MLASAPAYPYSARFVQHIPITDEHPPNIQDVSWNLPHLASSTCADPQPQPRSPRPEKPIKLRYFWCPRPRIRNSPHCTRSLVSFTNISILTHTVRDQSIYCPQYIQFTQHQSVTTIIRLSPLTWKCINSSGAMYVMILVLADV